MFAFVLRGPPATAPDAPPGQGYGGPPPQQQYGDAAKRGPPQNQQYGGPPPSGQQYGGPPPGGQQYGGPPQQQQYVQQPVVMQQQVVQGGTQNAGPGMVRLPDRQYKYGLCSCCEDLGACCCVLWCPCCAAAEIMENSGSECIQGWMPWFLACLIPIATCGICPCVWTYSCFVTAQFKKTHHMREDAVVDCCLAHFCLLCEQTRQLREAREHPVTRNSGKRFAVYDA